jgi:membrane fusion protein (multidrug efflux system)
VSPPGHNFTPISLWVWVGLSAIVASIVSVAWFASALRFLPNWLGGEREIIVRVTRVRQHVGPVTVRAKGELLPVNELEVTSRLAGKVTEVRFNVGDAVPANAVVAVVESRTLTQRLAELEAALSTARKSLKTNQGQLDGAEKQLARIEELYRQDLIARRDVEQETATMETARAQTELARAQVAQQEALLAQTRALQGFTRVTTPVGGVVLKRHVNPGATIAASSVIVTIANLAALRMKATIPAEFAGAVHAGMNAKVIESTAPEKILDGKVIRVERPATDGERIAAVEIGIAAVRERVQLGTSAEAAIALDKDVEAIWLPRPVVIVDGGKNYVYKLVGDRAVRQEVTLGASERGRVEIVRGLKNGDWLIVDQLSLLKSGIRVRVGNPQPPVERSRD